MPTTSTMIVSGAWKTTRCRDSGSRPVDDGRAEHDGRGGGGHAGPPRGRPAASAQPRSASSGIPIGATRTLPASAAPRLVAEPGLGSVERDGEVGLDDGVGRITRRHVHGRRDIHRDDGDPGQPRPADQFDRAADRLAQGALDATPEERVHDDRGVIHVVAEDRELARHGRVDTRHARLLGEAVPVPGRVRRAGAGLR